LSVPGRGGRSASTTTSRITSAAVAALLLVTTVASSSPAAPVDFASPLPDGVRAHDGYGGAMRALSASSPSAVLVAAAAIQHGWRTSFAAPPRTTRGAARLEPRRGVSPPRPRSHRKQPLPRSARNDASAH